MWKRPDNKPIETDVKSEPSYSKEKEITRLRGDRYEGGESETLGTVVAAAERKRDWETESGIQTDTLSRTHAHARTGRERERERETETDRQTVRETDRQTDRQ